MPSLPIRSIPVFLLVVCYGCGPARLAAAPPDARWFPQPPALPEPAGQVILAKTVDELYRAAEQSP